MGRDCWRRPCRGCSDRRNCSGSIGAASPTAASLTRIVNLCSIARIAPEFGDSDTDSAAKATLDRLFPGREVVRINIDAIAAGGGGIHCTTQQEPAD
ncbi:MAG: aguA1 [Nocardia sp.]|nr:aguA1 [Nocardia sp.]